MGTIGVIGHLINNNIDFVKLILMGPTAMPGALLGSKFTKLIKYKVCNYNLYVFESFMIIIK